MAMATRVSSGFAESEPRFRDLLPALALLIATVGGLGILSAMPGGNERQLAVLFPPGIDRVTAAILVAEAGGELVDASRLPNLVIASSDGPGFARALYKVGAWLVMTPIVARGCGAVSLAKKGFD